MKKARIWIAVQLIIVMGISACTTKKDTEPAEIRFQLLSEEGVIAPFEQPYIDAVEDFQKLHPQINVRFTYMPPGKDVFTDRDFLEFLKSDDPPDIVPFSPTLLELADQGGLLKDLQQLQFKNLDIPDPVLDYARRDGKLLVLPYAAYPGVVMFNKDIFDEAQIPYPQGDWTWEQFRGISSKLTDRGSALPYNIDTLDLLLLSRGSSVLSPDGDHASGYLDSPEAVRAMQWLNAYYRDDAQKTRPSDGGEILGAFDSRQIGMIVGAMGMTFSTFSGEAKEKLGIAPLPRFEDGQRANPVYFRGFAISSRSKHPQEALEFIEYLTLTQNEHSLKLAQNYLPTSISMAEAAGGQSDPARSVYLEELNYTAPRPGFNPHFFQMWNENFTGQFNELFTSADDEIAARLHELAQQVDAELKRLEIESETGEN